MFMLFCTQKLQSCFALLMVCVQTVAVVPPLTYRFLNHILPRSTYYSALKTEATHSSKVVVLNCHSTRRHTTEDNTTYFQFFRLFLCILVFNPHIYALILSIFQPFLKKRKQTALFANKQTNKHSKYNGEDVRLHIVGIEQVQTGPDAFRHAKHSLSAMVTERN